MDKQDNVINTTINRKFGEYEIELFFQHIDKYLIGDILTLNNIVGSENNSSTYCTVPQLQAIFAFADVFGYLLNSNTDKEKINNENDTSNNLTFFFTNAYINRSGSKKYLFSSEYKRFIPFLKKIYRDGIVHQYLPKSVYVGLSKSFSETDPLFVQNSWYSDNSCG